MRKFGCISAFLSLACLCSGLVAQETPQNGRRASDQALEAAQAAVLERQYSQAIHILEQALHTFPEDNRLRVELGEAYLDKGSGRRAERLFREALRREPASRLAKLGLARALGYRQDYKLSNQVYEELLSANREDEAAAIGLANNLMRQKRTVEAMQLVKQALAYHPNSMVLQEYKDRLDQGELGGDEPQVTLPQHELAAGGDYISDSSGNHSWRSSQRFDWDITPRLSTGLQAEQRWLSGRDASPIAVGAATQQVRLRLAKPVGLILGGGGVRFGDGTDRALYESALQFRPVQQLELEVGFSRIPFSPDALAAHYNLTAEGWHSALQWRPQRWTVNAWWSKQHYSDGNVARRESAEALRWFGGSRLAFGTGYRFTHYAFRDNPEHGYFSPNGYQSHLGLGGVRLNLGKTFHTEYLARAGAESLSRGGPFQMAWELSLRNWVSLKNWEIGVDYFHFHVAQDTGAFVARAGRVDLRYRF